MPKFFVPSGQVVLFQVADVSPAVSIVAPVKFVPDRFARDMVASDRFAFIRLALVKDAPDKYALFRFAPAKSASFRFALVSFAFGPIRYPSISFQLSGKDLG